MYLIYNYGEVRLTLKTHSARAQNEFQPEFGTIPRQIFRGGGRASISKKTIIIIDFRKISVKGLSVILCDKRKS